MTYDDSIYRGIVVVVGGSTATISDSDEFTIDGMNYKIVNGSVMDSNGVTYPLSSMRFTAKNSYTVDLINHKVVGDNPYKVKVRVPPIDGGTNSSIRIADELLRWYTSIVPFDESDINKVVVVGYIGGSKSDGMILGKVWES